MRYRRQVVERELSRLGVEVHGEVDEEWWSGLCPIHEDSSPSFSVLINEGGWICRAGCGKSGDLAELVSILTAEDFKQAQERLRRGEGAGTADSVLRTLERTQHTQQQRTPPPLFYDKGQVPTYMIERGFTKLTLARWSIGFDQERQAAVIPVWFKEKLRGLIYRRINGEPKYQNTPFEKGSVLFGWDVLGTQSSADPLHPVLVEGPLDAMWFDQHSIPALATLGSSLSEAQAELIRRRFWGVTLCFDEDKAGHEATREAAKKLSGLDLRIAQYPEGRNDPQECNENELGSLRHGVRYVGGLLLER